jgi:putative hydrolase of the HAD superfamily
MRRVIRAVVFDLWNTLVTWPEDESHEFRRWWSARMGVEAEALDAVWYGPGAYEARESGPIAVAIASVHAAFGVEPDVGDVVDRRLEMTLRALVPDPGVAPTLIELRRRGIAIGLISNCTEDVALVWDESPFAALVDVAVFSATAACMKPERRIYELALTELGREAAESLFVGDGANDELEGARSAGMTPVLFQDGGQAPRWPALEGWGGLRVIAIPQVLDLVA